MIAAQADTRLLGVRPATWLAVVACYAFVATGAFAQPAEPADPAAPPAAETDPPQPPPNVTDTELPKLQDLTVPSAEELLTQSPRDWIVLKTQDVVICEPVSPRPDTLAKRRVEIEAKAQERRGKTGEELERIQAEYDLLFLLLITLPEDTENPEYALPINQIERIVHHEDLVLQRIDALIEEGGLATAFELLLRLERQWDSWPGVPERHNKLLFADGRQRLQNGDPEAALVVLTDLRERAPDFAGLSDAIAEALGTMASRAIAAGDQRAARHFLFRLDDMYPGHAVFQQHSAEMAQRANELLSAAEQASRDGQAEKAADLAEQAAVYWPRTPNLMPRFRPLAQRYQRLRVGVVSLPVSAVVGTVAAVADPAAQRERELMNVPLFEVDRFRNGSAYYRTRYFESWEPFDLGRRLLITLRQSRQPWETQPIIDAPAFVSLLEQHLDSDDPKYDERLSGYIESVAVRSPVELELRFRRVPARVEPLLAALVPTDVSDGDENVAGISPGGFTQVESSAGHAVLRRAVPEPDGLAEYHVAEVVEHLYPSYDKAVLGLRQGEVSMLVDLPDWIVRRVQVDPRLKDELFVQQYALPTTHILQVNPASPALRIRELRRALLHALDRERILKETVLRDPNAAHGRVVTSPFPSFSPANSLDVGQHAFDQSAALALVLAAAQQMDNQFPTLKLLVPPTPVERAAAEQLVRDWRRIRIEVELVDLATVADDDDDWDLCYRTLQIAEPTVALWPFLSTTPTARIADLSVFPDWLRQSLVDIDRTSDWGRALETVNGLHAKLWSEVRCLPLWEVDNFLVVRRNVQGFPDRPMHPYHGIERWTMQAWYPAE